MSVSIFTARIVACLLNCFGAEVSASGISINSASFPMRIEADCLAVEPAILYFSAVICIPATIKKRLWGLLAGLSILHLFNLLRIILLYFVGVHAPKSWAFYHIHVSQPALVFVVAMIWLAWLSWPTIKSPDATSTAGMD